MPVWQRPEVQELLRVNARALLKRSVRGRVLEPHSTAFDGARQLFNLATQRVPAFIVQCACAADVQAALRFARDEQLPVTARAGGHSVGGFSSVSSGVVLDLRALDTVSFREGTLSAGGGCLWSDVLQRLGEGRGVPGPFDPRVGVAGLTLGGGFGILTRLYGLTLDSLTSADVVTPDGARLRTSPTEEPELFWALRGAGAGLAVATTLRFDVHPLQPLLAATVTYPLRRLREVLTCYRDFVAGLPAAATVYLGFSTSGLESEPVQLHGFYFGDPTQGARVLAPLGRFGGVLREELRPLRYVDAHAPNDDRFPVGHHHRWRSHLLATLPDDALALLAEPTARAPLWGVLEHLGGAMANVPPDATAFPWRNARFGFVSALKWRRGARKPVAALAAQQRLHDALAPHALGSYLNYLDQGDAAALAWGSNVARLQRVKRQLDPHNLLGRTLDLARAL